MTLHIIQDMYQMIEDIFHITQIFYYMSYSVGAFKSAGVSDFVVECNLQSGWTLRWSTICNQAGL